MSKNEIVSMIETINNYDELASKAKAKADAIRAALKEEIDIPSKLLEHACGRIVKRLFRDFPKISEIEIKLSKRNPPMGADIDSAGVEMHCTRD